MLKTASVQLLKQIIRAFGIITLQLKLCSLYLRVSRYMAHFLTVATTVKRNNDLCLKYIMITIIIYYLNLQRLGDMQRFLAVEQILLVLKN